VALLFGAVVPMDLRLIGLWRPEMPLREVLRLLRPMAAAGAVLAVASGLLLFSVQATDYVALRLFFVKLTLVALGLSHALLWGSALGSAPRAAQRTAGAVSLAAWTGALACGRLLGYL
jgi:hypothetical protein